MMLLTKKLEFMSTIGDVLSKKLLDEVVAECVRFGVDCTLNHNGTVHTITQYTNTEELEKNWFR